MSKRLRALLTGLFALGALMLVPASPALAAGDCSFPVSSFIADTSSGTTFWKGRGAYTCNNVHAIDTKVELYYRQGSAHPYQLRTTTGWDPHAKVDSSVTWVRDTVYTTANCGDWYVRAWVRFTRNGTSTVITRDDMTIKTRNLCG